MKVQNNKGEPLAGAQVIIDRHDGLGYATFIFDSNGEMLINDSTLYRFSSSFQFTHPGYDTIFYTGDQLGPNAIITMDKSVQSPNNALIVGLGLIAVVLIFSKLKKR